ncbi:MAG: radical SAM protein [Candidatus Binatia bacterium]
MGVSDAEEHVALSRALVVALRFNGLSVPGGAEPDVELQAPELLLIAELARGGPALLSGIVADIARRAGVSEPRLRELVDRLRGRGLLVAASPTALPAPAAPTAGNGRAHATPTDGVELAVATPQLLRPTPAGFLFVDHEGRTLAALSAPELAAISVLSVPRTLGAAVAEQRQRGGALALDAEAFAGLVARLAAVGLVAPPDQEGHKGREDLFIRSVVGNQMRYRTVVAQRLDELLDDGAPASGRVTVVPFDCWNEPIPLALGMLIAHARAVDGGRLLRHYDFLPQTKFPEQQDRILARGPAILLFSNYLWSHVENLRTSARAKAMSPGSVTIHGGPDTPKYEGDIDTYFRANPHVDVAVRGEGEETFAAVLAALVGRVDGRPVDLSALRDVPGLCFRDGAQVVRTPDRTRIADLDALPSPYLSGVFDVHAASQPTVAVIETNRGCPYGCTFCDWGSATNSRLRKFSMERIFAELEWCAQRGIPSIILADANFGIFERDIDIARRVVELNRRYGFPKHFGTNYAKNNTTHLRQIIRMLIEANIICQGLLSLQSMDQQTLATVRRSNIKTEKYDDLAREFRHAKLPLFIDLMVGLPGATPASFANDLQGAIDREVTAKVFQTELLNSPMNDPAYRAAHRIETLAPFQSLGAGSANGAPQRAFVVASSSFTRAPSTPRCSTCDRPSSCARTTACCASWRASFARRPGAARSTSTPACAPTRAPTANAGRPSRPPLLSAPSWAYRR